VRAAQRAVDALLRSELVQLLDMTAQAPAAGVDRARSAARVVSPSARGQWKALLGPRTRAARMDAALSRGHYCCEPYLFDPHGEPFPARARARHFGRGSCFSSSRA
jgi:hypothetical protein